MLASMTGLTNSPSPGVGAVLSEGSGSPLTAAATDSVAAGDAPPRVSSDGEQAAIEIAATSSKPTLGATLIRRPSALDAGRGDALDDVALEDEIQHQHRDGGHGGSRHDQP